MSGNGNQIFLTFTWIKIEINKGESWKGVGGSENDAVCNSDLHILLAKY